MENKQSAVEWYYREMIAELGVVVGTRICNRAQEIFKEQIMEAYESGCTGIYHSEQYYNETYGK